MSDESGQTAMTLFLALWLFAALGVVAVDIGLLLNDRAQSQAAADLAALAAAQDLPASATDPDAGTKLATAHATGLTYALKNDHNAGDADVQVTVTTNYDGNHDEVEVVLARDRSFIFGQLLGLGDVSVGARAVARRTESSSPLPYAMLALSPSACEAFLVNGSFDLTVNGGAVQVNSDCPTEAVRIFGSANVQTDGFDHYQSGGVRINGNVSVTPAPSPVPWVVPDPYAGLPPIDLGALGTSPDSCGTQASPQLCQFNGGSTVLQPGVFWGGISINGNADVTFASGGIFVMAGGGLSINGSTQVSGDGVLIHNTGPACGPISLNGDSDIQITQYPNAPYENLTIWQDAACTVGMIVNGSADVPVGTIYLPTAELAILGSGDVASGQLIADTFRMGGSGDLTLNFVPYAVGSTGEFTVELVY